MVNIKMKYLYKLFTTHNISFYFYKNLKLFKGIFNISCIMYVTMNKSTFFIIIIHTHHIYYARIIIKIVFSFYAGFTLSWQNQNLIFFNNVKIFLFAFSTQLFRFLWPNYSHINNATFSSCFCRHFSSLSRTFFLWWTHVFNTSRSLSPHN